ncbi:MAG: RsfS/YbeB/iojap family protein [Acholeplasmatales bacterium]|jgi:ribosome-associated protein|nr:RsfS/YbeB/iojap family protein [Acholeplasmatales bacterium]
MKELSALEYYKINQKLLNLNHNEKVVLSILASYEDLEELVAKINLSDFIIQPAEQATYLTNKYPFIKRIKSKLKAILALKLDEANNYLLKGLSLAIRQKYQLLSYKEVYIINNKTIALANQLGVVKKTKKEYLTYFKEHIGEIFAISDGQKYLKLYLVANRDLKIKAVSSIQEIYDILVGLKIKDIRVYDFQQKSPFYDYFVVGTVNEKQASAVISHLKQASALIRNVESSNDWTLIDLYDTVIHLFSKEGRSYYNFDDKWLLLKRIDNQLGAMN